MFPFSRSGISSEDVRTSILLEDSVPKILSGIWGLLLTEGRRGGYGTI